MHAETDQDLLLYMAAGDEAEQRAALEEFYKRHIDYIYRRVLRIGNLHRLTGDDIDGLSVDILIKIYLKAGTFTTPDHLTTDDMPYYIKAWIGRIAQNHINDMFRSSPIDLSCSPLHDVGEDQETIGPEGGGSTEIDGDSPLLGLLKEALATLPPDDQAIIRWYISNQDAANPGTRGRQGDTKEIADAFGTTPAAIRQRVSRSKRKIHEYMESADRQRSA